MSFLANILKHSSQSVVSGLVSAVGSFAASVIIARLLGVEGTATVAMALWLVFLSITLADVGITGTLARFAAECPPENDHAAARQLTAYAFRFLVLAILAGLVLTASILWLYWGDIQAKYAADRTQGLIFCGLVLVCFVIHMLFAFAYQFLRGTRAFNDIALYSLLGTCLQIGGAVAGSLWFGSNGALAAYILFSLPMIFSLRKVRLAGPVEHPPAPRRMRSYAISFYLSVLFSPLLWVRADILIVDQVIGAKAVGLMAAAGTIAALLMQVCQMICSALLPNIVHAARDDRQSFASASRIAVRMSLLLLLPACLIAAAAAPEAIGAVFGPAFAAGGTMAAVLCLAGLGSALTLVVSSVLSAEDGNAVLARNGAIGAVVTLVSGTLLALSFGLVGAALGRLVSQGLMGVLNLRSATRRVDHLVSVGWIFRILLAGTVGALVTEALGWWLGGSLPVVFLSLACGGLAYLVAAFLLLPLSSGEQEQLAALIGGLPGPAQNVAAWLLSRRRTA